jgi:hypothetical protein
MHQFIRKGAIAASALALAGGFAACEPNVNEDNLRHEVSTLGGNTWYTNDTRLGGGVLLVDESDSGGQITDGAPDGFGTGSLALTTNQSTATKAQAQNNRFNEVPFSDLERLSYQTYQHADHTGFSEGVPSFQITTADWNGATDGGGFATFTYEPYVNGTDITPSTWQEHDNLQSGQWYSSRALTCGDFTLTATQGSDTATLEEIAAACNPSVLQIGLNIGANNPNYVTLADDVEVAVADDDDEGTEPQTTTFDFGPKGSGS